MTEVQGKKPEAAATVDLDSVILTVRDNSFGTVPSTSVPDAPGLSSAGYGVEVQGYEHRMTEDGKALVFLPRDTRYRIRLSNANEHMCMTRLELDGINIGTFLQHPFSKCDIERPTDRALGFSYLMLEASAQHSPPGQANAAKKIKEKEKTAISATFKPEIGGKIIQIDVTTNHLNKTQRLEMLNETTVRELFEEVKRDFGDWILSPTCALIHWTSAEYDAPVEDIIRSDQNTALRAFRSRADPLRKMSLVAVDKIEITINEVDTRSQQLDTAPTFGMLLLLLEDLIQPSSKKQTLYFLSESGRYLCSSSWVQPQSCVLHVLHKDEILARQGVLSLKVVTSAPPALRQLVVRLMSGGTFELQVVPETTIRECRYQLEAMGGPWGEAPSWLFGGTLIESGRTIGCYDIRHRNIVDVVPRLQDKVNFKRLEMRDPIAVDGDKPVNTAELIRREEAKCNQSEKKQRKLARGGTTLRGRTKQQYIEVDPIDTDERFSVNLAITIMPKEHEEAIMEAARNPVDDRATERSCVIC